MQCFVLVAIPPFCLGKRAKFDFVWCILPGLKCLCTYFLQKQNLAGALEKICGQFEVLYRLEAAIYKDRMKASLVFILFTVSVLRPYFLALERFLHKRLVKQVSPAAPETKNSSRA